MIENGDLMPSAGLCRVALTSHAGTRIRRKLGRPYTGLHDFPFAQVRAMLISGPTRAFDLRERLSIMIGPNASPAAPMVDVGYMTPAMPAYRHRRLLVSAGSPERRFPA